MMSSHALAFDGWLEAVTCWCPHPPFGFLAIWPAGEAVYVSLFLMFILHHTRTEIDVKEIRLYYTSTLISYHASSLVPRPWGRRVTFFFPPICYVAWVRTKLLHQDLVLTVYKNRGLDCKVTKNWELGKEAMDMKVHGLMSEPWTVNEMNSI